MDALSDDPRTLPLSLATLLTGVAIGAVAAVFLTSRSRSRLPAHILGAAGDWREQAADALARVREQVVSAVEQSQAWSGGNPPSDTEPVRSS